MDRASRESGLTVLELLVAVTLFALFLGAALSFYLVHQRAAARGQEKIEVQQNARVALASAVREIRMAGYDPEGLIAELATPAAIQTAEPDRLTFLADVDDDGRIDRVTYRREGTSMVRAAGSWTGGSFSTEASSVVADDIVGLSFEYFDDDAEEDGAIPAPVASADLERIGRVRLGLVARRPSTAETEETFVLRTDVALRNRR